MPSSRDRQPHRVVVDTCCVIKGALDPDSTSGIIVSLATDQRLLIPYANAPLRQEIRHYLHVVGPKCGPDVSRVISTFSSRLQRVARPRNLGLDAVLVGGCVPDLEVIASSISAGNIPVITRDGHHLLSNARKILELTGIVVSHPQEWLEIFAPGLLNICR